MSGEAPTTVRGRPRDVPGTIVAALFTLGLWGAWYSFIAFREVDHQAGRRHSALFFLGFIPLVGIVFGLLYLRHELRDLQADRQRLGLPPGTPFSTLALWSTLGLLILAGPLVTLGLVARDVNGYWAEVYQRHGVPLPGPKQVEPRA